MSLWLNWCCGFMGSDGSVASGVRRYFGWLNPNIFPHSLPVLVLIGMAIVEVAFLWFGNPTFAIGRANEDGSLYLQIAQNIAQGHGVTFDQIAPTNAGHWGWLLLLAAVLKVFPTQDPETLFRIAGITYFLTLVAAAAIIGWRYSWVLGVFMVAYLANRGNWYMETHLVFLTLAMAMIWPNQVTGFLLTATRTDMMLFALFSMEWKLIPGAVIGFIWVCLSNIMTDGSVISVTAQLKSYGWISWGWNAYPSTHWTAWELYYYYFPVLPIMFYLALFSIDRWFMAAIALLIIHILRNTQAHGWYLAPLFLTSMLCAYRSLLWIGPMVLHWGLRLRHQWRLLGVSGLCG